jgi:hypothetical protein
MTEDEARPGDVVLDERRQAYLRLEGGGWRHQDLVLVESGQRWQPEGELTLLQRNPGELSENSRRATDDK